ncbi:MAG: aspartate carbamoyltransferase catalytic subunit [Clostridia bacterium]
MKGLLTLKVLSTQKICDIIDLAIQFKQGKKVDYSGKRMASLFYENSTRTQFSFQMAMLRLGITPITFNVGASSVAKGETLYDTVRTFEALGVDGVVIRHSQNEYYRDLENIQIPIFNGGDGTSNHPTQTLLDLMTIYEEFGRFDGLKVCIVGDIVHSRVAHGNAEIMKRLGMEVYICAPSQFVDDTGTLVSLDDAVKFADVINLLRVQFERHHDGTEVAADEYLKNWGMTMERVKNMNKGAIIIHPAPINRGIEIADDVAECNVSRIYKQMENGVYVRMAVIYMVMEGLL